MIKVRLEARHFFFYAILPKTIAIFETIVYPNANRKKLKFSLNGLSRKGPTLGVFFVPYLVAVACYFWETIDKIANIC